MTESLRDTPMKKLNEGRKIYDFKNVWISDGEILFKDGQEIQVYSMNHSFIKSIERRKNNSYKY